VDSINWFALDWYYYALGGGAILTVVALIVYFALGARSTKVKLPAGIVATVTALAAGVGGGALLMACLGYRMDITGNNEVAMGPPPGMMMPKGGMPGGPGKGKGGGKGGGFGAAPPSAKHQLADLVTKLDQLTAKPLALELNAAEKAQLRDALRGLAEQEKLEDKDAKERIDKILELLKGQRATLEAAGYRWPGGPVPRPADVANPFKEDGAGKTLQTLDKRLAG
jgi:hypothetical protein